MNSSIDLLPVVSLRFLVALALLAAVAYGVVRATTGPANRLAKRWGLVMLRAILMLVILALLTNPVSVQELTGEGQPAEVFYMLDASESMAVGNGGVTRWNQAVDLIRDSTQTESGARARISLFKFGRRLEAIGDPAVLGLPAGSATADSIPLATRDEPEKQDGLLLPNESDTQMLVALRQISSRFGRQPPASIVLFSDGRARDEGQIEKISQHFATLDIPIHVVPLGKTGKGGDASIVSVVVPTSVRKQSRVEAQVFLRSFGFDGQRAEIELNAIDEKGKFLRKLGSKAVTLQSGFQSEVLPFQSDLDIQRLEASIQPQANEVSTDNNRFATELLVDRTKIRILYLEGSASGAAPHADLQKALQADPDIECAVLAVNGGSVRVVSGHFAMFPRTEAELSAYDAIILSNVPRQPFNEEKMGWLKRWVSRRGGGLCMAGGRASFAAGGWNGTEMEAILPVQMPMEDGWRPSVPVSVTARLETGPHAIFRFLDDAGGNRQVIESFPSFRGAHPHLRPKPALTTVLAAGTTPADRLTGFGNESLLAVRRFGESPVDGSAAEFPVVTVGQFGKGRTMAIAVPITGQSAQPFRTWGSRDNEYYSQFWRNTVYWLTEGSFIGRRRLVGSVDKRYYRPGETAILNSVTFDETGSETSLYKVLAMIEPDSFDDIESDFSPVHWPEGLERTSGIEEPFIAWGEEFEIPLELGNTERPLHKLELTIADAHSIGAANQSLRIELTAYEEFTQVDSMSLAVQLLHDPFEQQNPFPNHELLHELAANSGGRVLESAEAIRDQLANLPVMAGPTEIRRTPVWSRWWLLVVLIGLLTVEWCWRRAIGLA